MSRVGWIAGLALLAAACAEVTNERARAYGEDGVLLYQRGAYADARESFEAALALQPGDANLLYNLAQCHDRLGHVEKAERLYQECLLRAPDRREARHALVVLLVNTGRRAEAGQYVADWLRRQPTRAAPYVEDGWLFAHDGDLDKARGRLQQAIGLEPRDSQALTELARLNERLGRLEYAVVLYERSLESNPNQPDVAARVSELRARGVARPHPD
jgi:tetratricopeptide (TPR) repeat protein